MVEDEILKGFVVGYSALPVLNAFNFLGRSCSAKHGIGTSGGLNLKYAGIFCALSWLATCINNALRFQSIS